MASLAEELQTADNERKSNRESAPFTKTSVSATDENSSKLSSDFTLVSRDSPSRNNSTMIQRQPQRRIFKIIVIGDSNVGKTCLTYRFCSGKFPDKTEATIGVDFRERTCEINNDIVKLQLWDTAGQERFRKSMVQHYYRNVHAVVFVYDVTKRSSFESMPGWIEECDRHNLTRKIPRILVGNKCDVVDRVAVNTNTAQKFADSHSMPLFETSAKDEEKANHIESIFMTLAHKLQQSRPMMSNRVSGDVDGDTVRRHPVITIGQQPTGYGLTPGPPGGEDRAEKCTC